MKSVQTLYDYSPDVIQFLLFFDKTKFYPAIRINAQSGLSISFNFKYRT